VSSSRSKLRLALAHLVGQRGVGEREDMRGLPFGGLNGNANLYDEKSC
jgi:hypothetical protein